MEPLLETLTASGLLNEGTLPEGFSRSFRLCPIKIEGGELTALVESPLPEASIDDLDSIFGLKLRQLLGASHHMALARQRIYGIPLDAGTRELEARLARRRGLLGIQGSLTRLSRATTLTAAIDDVLDFAAGLLEFSCFLVCRQSEFRVAASRGSEHARGASLVLPDVGCSLGAAIRYGGYFMGPIRGTDADTRFHQALGRPLPRWALLAPIPTAGEATILFHADNGPRGIATRWVAELTLLTSRLGNLGKEKRETGQLEEMAGAIEDAFQLMLNGQAQPVPDTTTQAGADETGHQETPPAQPQAEPPPGPDAAERATIERLRRAATAAGQPLDTFVDDLLREHGVRSAAEDTHSIASELKDLFGKLATDIPTQLARGMETAFREMAPRLAGVPADLPTAQPQPRSAAAHVGLERKEAGPREVPSYRARRCKTKRIKL
jgi:hypothetical protein